MEVMEERRVLRLPLSDIRPNPAQPRRVFEENALRDLASSIRRHGVLQPLTVRRQPGGWELVAGERRLRAARLAGLETVPCIEAKIGDQDSALLALVENLQREDLNPMEEAGGYRVLMEEYGLTQEEVSQRVGRSRPSVANALRLLALPESVCRLLEEGQLSAGHGRAILSASGEEVQKELAQKVLDEGLSVRQTEALARRLAKEQEELKDFGGEKPVDPMKIYRDAAAKDLSTHWGRKVSISMGAKKGKLEIEFYNDEDLTLLLDQLENQVPKEKGGTGV